MNSFSISQLAQFSGIKPHTIRIWEQRYNALQPQRSEGNTRYYDGMQLRRLLNIVSLSKTGYKVSKLCTMEDEELFDLQRNYYDKAAEGMDFHYFVSQLISAGLTYDEFNFEKTYSHCLLRFGLKKTYQEVIYPVITRIGLLWSSNSIPPSQEHYITNLLRQKLFTSIDSLPAETDDSDTWVLFLPEDEFHEIGLLFANYLLRRLGKNVIYLGPNVPVSCIESLFEETNVSNLLLFMVHRDLPENIEHFLKELKSVGKDKNIFIAVNSDLTEEVSNDHGITWLFSVEDLEEVIVNNENNLTEVHG